jgi:hypothetical protein
MAGQNFGIEHAEQIKIITILSHPRDFFRCIDPEQTFSDNPVPGHKNLLYGRV